MLSLTNCSAITNVNSKLYSGNVIAELLENTVDNVCNQCLGFRTPAARLSIIEAYLLHICKYSRASVRGGDGRILLGKIQSGSLYPPGLSNVYMVRHLVWTAALLKIVYLNDETRFEILHVYLSGFALNFSEADERIRSLIRLCKARNSARLTNQRDCYALIKVRLLSMSAIFCLRWHRTLCCDFKQQQWLRYSLYIIYLIDLNGQQMSELWIQFSCLTPYL